MWENLAMTWNLEVSHVCANSADLRYLVAPKGIMTSGFRMIARAVVPLRVVDPDIRVTDPFR